MPTQLKKDKYSKEDALSTIERNIGWINSADNKASIMLGVLSFLFGGLIITVDSVKLQQMIDSGQSSQYIHAIGIALSGLTLSISILCTVIFLLLVLIARTSHIVKDSKNSVFFFNDISNSTLLEFHEITQRINEEEIIEDLISQVYATSLVATSKYRYLRKGYISFAIAVISSFIYLFLMYLLFK
ncbi:MAG: hypothetical protein CVV57_01640 [Tenericutes bacterium HGW-Tenericutes-2]|jgi:hypothetical protein|nr:MAG: hypothetical protein CVV57_01640 [Tenericutes bacterium HGW-Tenericutes-2]